MDNNSDHSGVHWNDTNGTVMILAARTKLGSMCVKGSETRLDRRGGSGGRGGRKLIEIRGNF